MPIVSETKKLEEKEFTTLKELQQKCAKAKSKYDVFNASCQQAKSSFFAIMDLRLRKQTTWSMLFWTEI